MNKLGGFKSLLFYCPNEGFRGPSGSFPAVLNFTPPDERHPRASACIRDPPKKKGVENSVLALGELPKEGVQIGSPEPKHSPGCSLGLQLPVLHPAMQGGNGDSEMAARIVRIDPRLLWSCG